MVEKLKLEIEGLVQAKAYAYLNYHSRIGESQSKETWELLI